MKNVIPENFTILIDFSIFFFGTVKKIVNFNLYLCINIIQILFPSNIKKDYAI